ncbi:MAG: thioredoxin [Planctomycetes bacterium]|nr:thioredoxin [Planctomycetota bacterium]
MALELNDANFASEVLSSDIPVIVDFSAEWCGPCRMLGPIIEQLAVEYEGRVKVGKVDIDEAQEMAAQFGIMSVPTVIFFKGGEKVGEMVGVKPKEKIKAQIEALL